MDLLGKYPLAPSEECAAATPHPLHSTTLPSPPPPFSSITIIMPASRQNIQSAVASSSHVVNNPDAIRHNALRRGEIHTYLVEFERSFNRSKFRRARGSRSCPYPEAQDVFIQSGGVSLGDERFEDLFLADTITVTKRAGRHFLRHAYDRADIHPDETNHLQPLLRGLLDRGLQHNMDVDENGEGSQFQYAIGYTASVGVGLLQEIRKANDLVSRILVVFDWLILISIPDLVEGGHHRGPDGGPNPGGP
jgi:hypothetical protein